MCHACQSDPAHWTWTDPLLRDLVADLLEDWVDQGRSFTAYEVTAALRRDHPNTALPHTGGVREQVHAQMAACLAQGRYTQRPVSFYNNGWAMQYVPSRQPRRARTRRLTVCPPPPASPCPPPAHPPGCRCGCGSI